MTDEEKAEQYVKENGKVYYHSNGEPMFTREEDLKFAFLAGLKAGRPKWHKVIDGFMPPMDKFYDTINVLTDKGDIAYYSYNFDCWVAEPSSLEIDPPIAWCEIPKFKEE